MRLYTLTKTLMICMYIHVHVIQTGTKILANFMLYLLLVSHLLRVHCLLTFLAAEVEEVVLTFPSWWTDSSSMYSR